MTDQDKADLLAVAAQAVEAGFTVDELCETISSLKFRKVIFCSVFIGALKKAVAYSLEHNTNIVSIGKLTLDTKEYARFNDLVRFGFCAKPESIKGGQYMLDVIKAQDFLNGLTDVAEHYYVNPIDRSFSLSDKRITIKEVVSVKKAQKIYGPKMTTYAGSLP